MHDTFHVLFVNTEEVVEHNGRSHTPESLCKLVDIAHHVDIEGIARLQTKVNQINKGVIEHEGADSCKI